MSGRFELEMRIEHYKKSRAEAASRGNMKEVTRLKKTIDWNIDLLREQLYE